MNDMDSSTKPKVLIVDDRQENLFAMKRTLSRVDADLFTAESGNEALKLTIHHSFALILLDVQIPGMDGYEVATLLREREATAAVPIVFVTANDKDERNAIKGYETGAVDYIFKPVNTDILASKVAVFLTLHKQKQLLAQRNAELNERNAELDNFSNIVAHEIQEPLRMVSGFSEYLKGDYRGKLDEKADRYLRRIEEECSRMIQAVQGLLEYTWSYRGRSTSKTNSSRPSMTAWPKRARECLNSASSSHTRHTSYSEPTASRANSWQKCLMNCGRP